MHSSGIKFLLEELAVEREREKISSFSFAHFHFHGLFQPFFNSEFVIQRSLEPIHISYHYRLALDMNCSLQLNSRRNFIPAPFSAWKTSIFFERIRSTRVMNSLEVIQLVGVIIRNSDEVVKVCANSAAVEGRGETYLHH